MNLILGVETSCDDTCVAVLKDGHRVLANVVSSQDDLHQGFGGVVPELASRRHTENFIPVLDEALRRAGISIAEVDLIAATRGPGLVGSLLVGFMAAKGLAWELNKPLVGVNHLLGHICAVALDEGGGELPSPAVCLVVSGGHTNLVYFSGANLEGLRPLGQTRDDAAGEAFDKVARLLDLGYPGGPHIDALAEEFEGHLIDFPRPMLEDDSLDFSFSGLKTAVALYLEKETDHRGDVSQQMPADKCRVAASFQSAAVDVLRAKSVAALRMTGANSLIVVGGVAANRHLRRELGASCQRMGVALYIPKIKFCTDNAAMIAQAGLMQYQLIGEDPLTADVDSSWGLFDLGFDGA